MRRNFLRWASTTGEVMLVIPSSAVKRVVAPGAAEPVRLLDDLEVVEPRVAELDGGADAGDARANDDDTGLLAHRSFRSRTTTDWLAIACSRPSSPQMRIWP